MSKLSLRAVVEKNCSIALALTLRARFTPVADSHVANQVLCFLHDRRCQQGNLSVAAELLQLSNERIVPRPRGLNFRDKY